FYVLYFFFSSRRRHTRSTRDWSSDVCSSDLGTVQATTPATLIKLIYELALAIVALAGFAAFLFAGVQYVTAAGNPSRAEDAKDRSEERRVGREGRCRWWRDGAGSRRGESV